MQVRSMILEEEINSAMPGMPADVGTEEWLHVPVLTAVRWFRCYSGYGGVWRLTGLTFSISVGEKS